MEVMVDSRTRILNVAQELCQRVGPLGFSFRDLGQAVDLSSATIHHHFATKNDLLLALLDRYQNFFHSELSRLANELKTPSDQMSGFIKLLGSMLSDKGSICLCGMLAGQSEQLDPDLREKVAAFFSSGATWLAQCLRAGREGGEFDFVGTPEIAAQSLMAALQGMLVSARMDGGRRQFENMASWLQETVS